MKAVISAPVATDTGHPESIVRGVSLALRTSGYRDLFDLRCECEDGVITLVGRVGSYFLKQVAQTVAGRVEGVKRVNNQLQVT
jgi:osmotically-inducible protein OsmY